MSSFVCVGDIHYITPDEREHRAELKKAGHRRDHFMRVYDREINRNNPLVDQTLASVSRLKPPLVEIMGDFANIGMRGLVDERLQSQAIWVNNMLDEILAGIEKDKVPGTHEVGFYFPFHHGERLDGNDKCGPSLESFLAFEKHIGPLWSCRDLNEYRLVRLCSDLWTIKSRAHPLELRTKKIEQTDFFSTKVAGMFSDQKLIIITHDPEVLPQLYQVLASNSEWLKKLQLTLVGHWHHPWLKDVIRWAFPIADRLYIYPLAHLLFRGKRRIKFFQDYLRTHAVVGRLWDKMKTVIIPHAAKGFVTVDYLQGLQLNWKKPAGSQLIKVEIPKP